MWGISILADFRPMGYKLSFKSYSRTLWYMIQNGHNIVNVVMNDPKRSKTKIDISETDLA